MFGTRGEGRTAREIHRESSVNDDIAFIDCEILSNVREELE